LKKKVSFLFDHPEWKKVQTGLNSIDALDDQIQLRLFFTSFSSLSVDGNGEVNKELFRKMVVVSVGV
jgi:hypothetical protein